MEPEKNCTVILAEPAAFAASSARASDWFTGDEDVGDEGAGDEDVAGAGAEADADADADASDVVTIPSAMQATKAAAVLEVIAAARNLMTDAQ